jgi:hypothetical protein
VQTNFEKIFIPLLFITGVAAIFVTRILIYVNYNIEVIDSDQPFMWLGASDYSKGLFYEPRYYGQGYNTFMEGLFAVPLIWCGVAVYYAVPLATHFIALFPFLFTACYLYFRKKRIQAILVLCVILAMPAAYDLLNSLPRGLVTGLFFTSFFIVSLCNPRHLGFILLNTICAVAGYFVNPNIALVSGPVLFYIFLCNYKSVKYYLITLLGLLTIVPFYLLFDRLYTLHPEYIINPLSYRFSTDFFLINISNLDERFAHISFFRENQSLLLLIGLLALGVTLFIKHKKAFYAYVCFISLTLFSFCFGKTLEGSTWAYMSFSRMYLGIPVVICLFIPFIQFRPGKWMFLLTIPLIFSAYKAANLRQLLLPHHDGHNWVGVHLLQLKSSLEAAAFYKKHCDEENVRFLLVSNRFWMNTVVAYGGPAIYNDYPMTQETRLEKRFWIRDSTRARVFKKFVLLSANYNLDKLIPHTGQFSLQRIDSYGLFLVTNNTLKTADFIDIVNTFEPMEVRE